jgi:hypothetical protein
VDDAIRGMADRERIPAAPLEATDFTDDTDWILL